MFLQIIDKYVTGPTAKNWAADNELNWKERNFE